MSDSLESLQHLKRSVQAELELCQKRLSHIDALLGTYSLSEVREGNAWPAAEVTPPMTIKNKAYEYIQLNRATTAELIDYVEGLGMKLGGKKPRANFAAHLSNDARFLFNKELGKWEPKQEKNDTLADLIGN